MFANAMKFSHKPISLVDFLPKKIIIKILRRYHPTPPEEALTPTNISHIQPDQGFTFFSRLFFAWPSAVDLEVSKMSFLASRR